jgi:hypothetical protein
MLDWPSVFTPDVEGLNNSEAKKRERVKRAL